MNQNVNPSLTRRNFVVASASAAGGLAICVTFPGLAEAATIAAQPFGAEAATPNEINAFLVIDPQGGILIRSPHNEMGQGAITALPMIVAEELECDWSKVKVEYASPTRNYRENRVYGDMVTAGSRGVRTSWKMLLQAGASARERLIAAAAQRWNVPASECKAQNSKVVHTGSLRTFDYGTGDPHPRSVHVDRQGAAAPRYPVEDQRHGEICHRYAHPRHGLCGDQCLPGRGRQACARR
jgi:isoquinoline 1-oxidoreductase beta subunit